MNKDRIKGGLKEFKGKVKEKSAAHTGNVRSGDEGLVDQIKGKAQKTWGKIKEKLD